MTLVDANLLLYAEDSLSDQHLMARTWWDRQLSGREAICLCWPVLTAFIRIGTNTRLQQRPLTVQEAIERVQSWPEQPCVRIIQPTDAHWSIFQRSGRIEGYPPIGVITPLAAIGFSLSLPPVPCNGG